MIPALLLADLAIWGLILKLNRSDIKKAQEMAMFDLDLYNIWKSNPPDKIDDIVIKQNLEKMVSFSDGSEEESWEETYRYYSIYDTDRILRANGLVFLIGDYYDFRRFERMYQQALMDQEYNSVPWDAGGAELCYFDWYRMLGYTRYDADKAVSSGKPPWIAQQENPPPWLLQELEDMEVT